MNNYIWTEKYRPKTYDDVIGIPKALRSTLDNLKEKTCLLLTGSPGTGKTTTSKILVSLNKKNSITLNASDERGIDVVRSRIKNFASNMSVDGGLKIINLEEFDEMTSNAQNALRNMMEEVPNCVWILTGNYENKIVDAIKNRCDHYRFKQPNQEDIKAHLEVITLKENMDVDADVLDKVIEIHYPSIRGMVKELERFKSLNRKITINDVGASNDDLLKIYEAFKEKKFMITRQNAIDSGSDYSEIIKTIHDKYLFEENIAPEKKLSVIEILGDSMRYINSVPSKEIEFESIIAKCFKVM